VFRFTVTNLSDFNEQFRTQTTEFYSSVRFPSLIATALGQLVSGLSINVQSQPLYAYVASTLQHWDDRRLLSR